MAALDGEQEIAERRGVGADDMQIGAQAFADHALGIADAGGAVERDSRWAGYAGWRGHACAVCRLVASQHAMEIGLGDAVHQRNAGLVISGAEPPAVIGDDDALDLDPAMRSAASTASRTAASASSMSMTTPALMPRER